MLPPELMGGAGGPEMMMGPGAPPAGPPAGPPPEAAPPPSAGDNVASLQTALEDLMSYIDGEDDELHIQTALQCLAKLQSILADEQKQSDDMLQGKSSPRALRRATSGQGY